jgi:hypothetical protein
MTHGNKGNHDDRSTERQVPQADDEAGGQQAHSRPGQDAAPRTDPDQAPLQALWPGAGGVSEVRHLPHLLPQPGQQRAHPWRPEGELVSSAQEGHWVSNNLDTDPPLIGLEYGESTMAKPRATPSQMVPSKLVNRRPSPCAVCDRYISPFTGLPVILDDKARIIEFVHPGCCVQEGGMNVPAPAEPRMKPMKPSWSETSVIPAVLRQGTAIPEGKASHAE